MDELTDILTCLSENELHLIELYRLMDSKDKQKLQQLANKCNSHSEQKTQ